MALRLSWSSRGGVRLTESKRFGRLRLWESIPITRGKNGRRRKASKGASFRL
jgi:hypothetical protein